MNKLLLFWITLFLCGLQSFGFAQKPLWQISLRDDIRNTWYLDNNTKVLTATDRSVGLYDQASGEKLWEMPTKNERRFLFEIAFPNDFFMDNRYFIVNDSGLVSYDALSGKTIGAMPLWGLNKQYLSRIDTTRDGFMRLVYFHPLPQRLFSVDIELIVDKSFQERSRFYKEHTHQGYDSVLLDNTLRETKRVFVANPPPPEVMMAKSRERIDAVQQGKYLQFNAKENRLDIRSLATNEVIASLPNTEAQRVSGFLGSVQLEWGAFTDANEQFAAIILEKRQVVLIDMVANKEVGRFQFEAATDGDQRLYAYHNAFLVRGNNSTLHILPSTANTTTYPFALKPSSTATYNVAEREITIFFSTANLGSLSNYYTKVETITAAVDMVSGELLWRNSADKPSIDIVQQIIGFDGTNLRLLTKKSQNDLFNPRQFGYVQSIDVLKGTTVYQTKVAEAHSGEYFSLEIQSIKYNDNDVVVIQGIAEAIVNPQTQKVGGEGVCVLDSKTGTVVASDYTQLSATLPAYIENDILYLLGRPNMLAFDLKNNKRLWLLTPDRTFRQDINPVDYIVEDGVMYLYHFGSKNRRVGYSVFDAPEPCGFYAIDLRNAKLAWHVPIEEAQSPTIAMTKFSLRENYDSTTHTLVYSTKKKLYGLQLRADGGKHLWVHDFSVTPIKEVVPEFYEMVIDLGEGNDRNQTKIVQSDNTGKKYESYKWIGGRDWFQQFPLLWEDKGREKSARELVKAGLLTGKPFWYGAWTERITRVDYRPQRVIIIGNAGLGCVDPHNGKMLWSREWRKANFQYLPRVIGSALVYMAEQKFVVIDIASGAVLAEEIWDKPNVQFSVAPDNKSIIGIHKNTMKMYRLAE